MLTLSSLHDLTPFTSLEYPDARYDADSQRLFATDGDTVISVPIDGESHSGVVPASSLPFPASVTPVDSINEFPDVLSAFPHARPQVFIPLDPAAIHKIAAYAAEHADSDEPLWLAAIPQGTSDFVQPDGKVLFFFVARDNGRKLVSGIISVPDVDAHSRQCVIGRSEAARHPGSGSLSDDTPESDLCVARHVRALRQRGYTVMEPGQTAPPARRQRPPAVRKPPKFLELLRAIAARDNGRVLDLIQRGVPLTERDSNSNSAMIHAARFGTPDMIHALAAAHPPLLTTPDGNGAWTPLMHAQDANRQDNIEALRSCGAANSQDQQQELLESIL